MVASKNIQSTVFKGIEDFFSQFKMIIKTLLFCTEIHCNGSKIRTSNIKNKVLHFYPFESNMKCINSKYETEDLKEQKGDHQQL